MADGLRTDVAVPFVDLQMIHAPLREALLDDLAGLIHSGAFINGPQVTAFESAFARYCVREAQPCVI